VFDTVPKAPGATPVAVVELTGGGGGGGAHTADEIAGEPAVVCVQAGAIPLATWLHVWQIEGLGGGGTGTGAGMILV